MIPDIVETPKTAPFCLIAKVDRLQPVKYRDFGHSRSDPEHGSRPNSRETGHSYPQGSIFFRIQRFSSQDFSRDSGHRSSNRSNIFTGISDIVQSSVHVKPDIGVTVKPDIVCVVSRCYARPALACARYVPEYVV